MNMYYLYVCMDMYACMYMHMYVYYYILINCMKNKFSACKTISTMVYLLAVRRPFIENEELLAISLIYRLTRNGH